MGVILTSSSTGIITAPPAGGTLFRALFNTGSGSGETPVTSYTPELDPAASGISSASWSATPQIQNATNRVKMIANSGMSWALAGGYTDTAYTRFDLWQILGSVPEESYLAIGIVNSNNDQVVSYITEDIPTGIAEIFCFEFPNGGSPTPISSPTSLGGAVSGGTACVMSHVGSSVTIDVGGTTSVGTSTLGMSSISAIYMATGSTSALTEVWEVDNVETDIT